MKTKIVHVLTLLFVCANGHAQIVRNSQLFSITSEGDTISFLKVNNDTVTPKPTILFCQGSLPVPLFLTDSKGHPYISVLNFDYQALSNQYNFVVISMPHTPLYPDDAHLNYNMAYVPDTILPTTYDSLYLKDNYLEKYAERGSKVIQFLKTQKWVNKNRIIVMGHSQGTHIGLRIASQNPDIFALGYFSGNISGRFSQFIREERKKSVLGLKTKEEAQTKINELYEVWKKICQDSIDYGDPNHTWKSFSPSFVQEITRLEMPVYVTYGTEDMGATDCDYLPVYFELVNKKNYAIRPFVGLGHNFEEILPNGRPNYDNMHWHEAVTEFVDWIEKQPDTVVK